MGPWDQGSCALPTEPARSPRLISIYWNRMWPLGLDIPENRPMSLPTRQLENFLSSSPLALQITVSHLIRLYVGGTSWLRWDQRGEGAHSRSVWSGLWLEFRSLISVLTQIFITLDVVLVAISVTFLFHHASCLSALRELIYGSYFSFRREAFP